VGEAGYFAVAPNQRGYAAGGHPDPADHSQYPVDRLVGDEPDIVVVIGHGDHQFHLSASIAQGSVPDPAPARNIHTSFTIPG
jgi:hypothetical protein